MNTHVGKIPFPKFAFITSANEKKYPARKNPRKALVTPHRIRESGGTLFAPSSYQASHNHVALNYWGSSRPQESRLCNDYTIEDSVRQFICI